MKRKRAFLLSYVATPSLISSNDLYISFFSPRQGVESAPIQDLKFLYKKEKKKMYALHYQ